MPTQPSSRFFRPHLLDAAAARRPWLTHARRRMLAGAVVGIVFAVAAGGAIYLAHPQRWRQPAAKRATAAKPPGTRVIQRQPGVADIEVQRGKEKHIYRFRQVEGQVVVEEVKPPEPRRSWWQRLFRRR
jgi:hypothetical protein